ncbi:hypothetical protein [Desulfovibrio oxyclinae]|uniref:hypothetical protein n=1 Tax=Desulfovibrio oxyclinae TaxID=63560 RepID=UPI000364BD11|nr:hypothetical protein [Desulfovibrio oxyclinae]
MLLNGFKNRKRLADRILNQQKVGGTGYWVEVCPECGGTGSDRDCFEDEDCHCVSCQGSGLIQTKIDIKETRTAYRPAGRK